MVCFRERVDDSGFQHQQDGDYKTEKAKLLDKGKPDPKKLGQLRFGTGLAAYGFNHLGEYQADSDGRAQKTQGAQRHAQESSYFISHFRLLVLL